MQETKKKEDKRMSGEQERKRNKWCGMKRADPLRRLKT